MRHQMDEPANPHANIDPLCVAWRSSSEAGFEQLGNAGNFGPGSEWQQALMADWARVQGARFL